MWFYLPCLWTFPALHSPQHGCDVPGEGPALVVCGTLHSIVAREAMQAVGLLSVPGEEGPVLLLLQKGPLRVLFCYSINSSQILPLGPAPLIKSVYVKCWEPEQSLLAK